MKKLISLSLFIKMSVSIVYAQTNLEPCYFDQVLSEKLSESSENTNEFNEINNEIANIISFNNSERASGDIYIVPVVVHVIHLGEPLGTGTNISDIQINTAITNLTDTYRNAFGNSIDNNIEFQLAVRDPNCVATNGIVRVNGSGVPNYATDGIMANGPGAVANDVKDLSKWPTDQYMNFWIVTEIDGNNGGFGIQGYANYPFAGDPYNGAVMMASIFGYDPTNIFPAFNLNAPRENSTAIHEVAHFLSVYHTFQGDIGGSTCPENITVGTDSDGCDDTPPHIRNASVCPTDGTNNPCVVVVGNLDQVKLNFMDYSSCPIKFTSDQKDRMRACLEGPRLSLVTSLALTPPSGVFNSPIVATCTPNTQALGLSGGYGGITSVIFSNLNSPTSPSYIDGGYKDFTGECLKVAYVELNEVVPLTINTWFNDHNVKVWIDYNNNGDFSDPGEEVFSQSLTGGTAMTQNITIPTTGSATIDTYLRMRVLADLEPVVNSCSDPTFGQAEDYVVYITETTPVADFTVNDVCNSITVSSVSGTDWISFKDPNGIIGAINPNGNTLGDVVFHVIEYSIVPMASGTLKYLPRYWNVECDDPINPGCNTGSFATNVDVKLYLNQSELDALNAFGTVTAYEMSDIDLDLYHYDGPNEDCDQSNNNYITGTETQVAFTTTSYLASSYFIQASVSSFSEFGIGGGGMPLPVELIEFNGSTKERYNKLNWSTASEANNDYFNIEKSIDGIHYNKIGEVQGNGNSTSMKVYSFSDYEINSILVYYKLTQVDFDGVKKEVGTIKMTREVNTVFSYPNPAKDELNFTFNSSYDGDIIIEYIDIQGKTISENVTINVNGSFKSTVFQALSSGIYVTRISENGTIIQSMKIVKL